MTVLCPTGDSLVFFLRAILGISGSGVGKTAAKHWPKYRQKRLKYKQRTKGVFNYKYQNVT